MFRHSCSVVPDGLLGGGVAGVGWHARALCIFVFSQPHQAFSEMHFGRACLTCDPPSVPFFSFQRHQAFSEVYRGARTISPNFLYAEFNWNNAEQFVRGTFDASRPLAQHPGSNNEDGGWTGGAC